MKKIIRLTESDIHRIVKDSVKRIIGEGLDEYPDEYYEYAQKFYRGDYSKKVINKLIQGCYDYEDEAIGAYEYAKRKGICPEFVKKVENDKSWVEFNGDAWEAETERNKALGRAYYDHSFQSTPYVDAEDETTNRFSVGKNPFLQKGARKGFKDDISSIPNGRSLGVRAQGDENDRDTRFARLFNGTRRSIPQDY